MGKKEHSEEEILRVLRKSGTRGGGLPALDKALLQRGMPESITVDNGPEFASKALDHWAYKHGVHLDFIRQDIPWRTATSSQARIARLLTS